jgi:hypothetical protein
VAKNRSKNHANEVRGVSRRTRNVWIVFAAAMTLLMGVFAVSDDGPRGGFLIATSVVPIGDRERTEPIFELDVPLAQTQWTGIVVHHLGRPAGDGETIHRLHLSHGHTGLGYHFVIGNGNGLGDGVIHVGYRWTRQQPGVHVFDEPGEHHNRHSIGICLVGNGERRPFTDRQMESLVRLVRSLQRELDIPAEHVFRHSDLVSDVASPGRFFASSHFDGQLLRAAGR